MDVIITDPPFDQRTHRAAVEVGPRVAGKRSVAGELPFPPLDAAKLVELAQHFVRVTRSWIVVFSGERQVEAWAAAHASTCRSPEKTTIQLRVTRTKC